MPRSLGIDIGTTRADLLLCDLTTGDAHSLKLPVPHGGLAGAVSSGVSQLLGRSGIQGGDVDRVVVALPQEIGDASGARVGLLVTRGFEQRLARVGGPEQGWLTRGVLERVSASGNVLLHLDEDAGHQSISELLAQRIDAIAVCLQHGHRNPAHEQRLRALIAEHGVDLPVFLSHEAAPADGEELRARSALMTARAAKNSGEYLDALSRGLSDAQVQSGVEVLQSTGERAAAGAFEDSPAGMIAGRNTSAHAVAARIAARAGFPNALSVEIGGSDALGAIIRRGSARVTGETTVGSGAIGLPSIDVRPVGEGVEALVTVPMAGTIRVGPGEAKPACAGGDGRPTVLDALAAVRRLPVDRLSLDLDAAEKSIAGPAGSLDLDLHRMAEGVVLLHAEAIAGELRRVAAEKGEDPIQLALVASGGAGPVLACDVAESIGAATVIVPQSAGALGAEGCATAGKASQFVATPGGSSAAEVADAVAVVKAKAEHFLFSEGAADHVEIRADVRVPGANFQTSVAVKPESGSEVLGELQRQVADAYRHRFSHTPMHAPVVSAIRAIATVEEAASPTAARRGGTDASQVQVDQTQVWFDGGFVTTPMLDGSKLSAGDKISAPALVLLSGTTVVVCPGWSGEVDADLNVILHAGGGGHDGRG